MGRGENIRCLDEEKDEVRAKEVHKEGRGGGIREKGKSEQKIQSGSR